MNAWMFLGIVCLGWAGWQGWRGGATRSWPNVPGRVISCQVIRSAKSHNRRVRISYEYAVEGATFHGSRIRYGYLSNAFGQSANDLAASFPEGSTVAVHHDPANPANSVLQQGVDLTSLLVPLGIGGVALIVGLTRAL